jgi:hypothetical protein
MAIQTYRCGWALACPIVQRVFNQEWVVPERFFFGFGECALHMEQGHFLRPDLLSECCAPEKRFPAERTEIRDRHKDLFRWNRSFLRFNKKQQIARRLDQ